MNNKVEQIVQQIMEEADTGREELMEKIEKKQEELSGFVTPEGAATIVARSYGVIPEREEPEVRKLRIGDLSQGMSNVDIVGRITRIFEPREFDRRDGSKGKVANLYLMDKTGEIRMVLWDKMVKLISSGEIQKGTPIGIKGAYIKKGRDGSPELNVGRRSKIEIEPEDERTQDLPPLSETKVKLSDLTLDQNFVDVVGKITAITTPRKFKRSNGSEGKVATLRLVDETGQVRVSLWGEISEKTNELNRGDAIRLENASVREGRENTPELHVNSRSRIVRNIPLEETKDLPEVEKRLLKIEEIEPDMPVLDLAARVRRIFPINEFKRDDGSEGRVMNVLLADETGTIRASFWDDMVETGQKLSRGDLVLLENARSSMGLQDRPEIRIGKRVNVKVNPENIEIEEMRPRRVKMSKLEEGMDSLEAYGRIIDMSESREFERSDGTRGEVASLTLGDESGTAKVVLWGSKTEILDKVNMGDTIKIKDSYSTAGRYGEPEIHLGKQADVEINPENEETIPPLEEIKNKFSKKGRVEIADAEEGSQVKIQGTVVRIFERRPFFNVCPKCGRSLGSVESEELCEKCGEVVEPDHKLVVNMIVDDGTGNIRVVAFGKLGEKVLGKTAQEVFEKLSGDAELADLYDEINLAGQRINVVGNVKRDEYFDQLELRAQELDFPDSTDEAEKILERIQVRSDAST